MLKRSAGILVYKIENNIIKVLLCHFGGPYWKDIDEGGWAIPKGELNSKENIKDAARREFNEETNLKIEDDLKYLGSRKVSHRKLAIIFYLMKDYDLSSCKSNTFKLKDFDNPNIINEYPEMDKYEWMDIETAKKKIIFNQSYFLEKLEEKIGDFNE